MPHSDPKAPLAIVMISLNEAHNMRAVLENIQDLAQEVFLVDSYSTDETVDIALEFGVHVVQRRFRAFGDQWNFALETLPITAPWTMKLDPDERLTDALKTSIRDALARGDHDAFSMRRRLWFMNRPLSVRQDIVRIWRTGQCRFSDVLVNEHPIISGSVGMVSGDLEHHDSPHLHHWLEKQNRYSTAEALSTYRGNALAARPRLTGTALERRMWLKRAYWRVPFRHALMFWYCWLGLGAWRAGKAGFLWAKMRSFVFQLRETKLAELQMTKTPYEIPPTRVGEPRPDVPQFD